MSERNELLRAHVTRAHFQLTLSKNMIAALIQLDRELADDRMTGDLIRDLYSPGRVVTGPNRPAGRNLLSLNVTSRGSLINRGLVTYVMPAEGYDLMKSRASHVWGITAAGRAVIVLLKESGLWDEVDAEVPWASNYQPAEAKHRVE